MFDIVVWRALCASVHCYKDEPGHTYSSFPSDNPRQNFYCVVEFSRELSAGEIGHPCLFASDDKLYVVTIATVLDTHSGAL